jgi:hypothetical protein
MQTIVAHLHSNTCILNKEDELHPLNQTAFTMLLREVTEHGSSELEARFDDLMYGLHPDRVAVFCLRLEERRTLLHDHPNTIAQHASSTPVASQPSVTNTDRKGCRRPRGSTAVCSHHWRGDTCVTTYDYNDSDPDSDSDSDSDTDASAR